MKGGVKKAACMKCELPCGLEEPPAAAAEMESGALE